MTVTRPVLMVMDMQRDFCDPNGAYARHGFDVAAVQPLIPRIARVMNACRTHRIPIVATQLTVLTDLDGKAMGLGHLRQLRPWLEEEGFRAGTPGHALVADLPPPNYLVRKWGYSAMYQTELEKILTALGIETLVFTGIATNGVVEGTARDAIMRGWHVVTLTDCVASFSQALHEASLKNLANIGTLLTSDDFLAALAQQRAPSVS
ncbi:MAG: isochorismatase family cysteine hydrolase [Chloroflexota bacterium]|nr:cysteine hydrolase [Dehalococcoidia bacterium]MDW8254677.1 isochorismatase family cysteine hydrolase [Chloroflexota bacterium]